MESVSSQTLSTLSVRLRSFARSRPIWKLLLVQEGESPAGFSPVAEHSGAGAQAALAIALEGGLFRPVRTGIEGERQASLQDRVGFLEAMGVEQEVAEKLACGQEGHAHPLRFVRRVSSAGKPLLESLFRLLQQTLIGADASAQKQ